jgi:hypothetical protein
VTETEPPGGVCTVCDGVGWIGEACLNCDGTGWDPLAGADDDEEVPDADMDHD